jgi:hypothetical protein
MPSYSSIAIGRSISSGSRGSRVYNPCGDGYGIGTIILQTLFDDMTTQNVTFLVCTPSSKPEVDDLGIGLGIGLGVGIPVLAALIYVLWRWGPRHNPPVLVAPAQRPLNNVETRVGRVDESVDPNKALFDKLGYHLHRQFLAGNLTNELKIILKSFSANELEVLERFAFDHNKLEISRYISQEITNKTVPPHTNLAVSP